MRFKQNFSLYPRRNKSKTVWYYRTYDAEGKRTTGTSTGLSSRAKAQAFCEKLFSEGLLITSDTENKPLKVFITDYFGDNSSFVKNKLLQNQLTLEQYKNSTLKTYKSYFEKHIFPFWENVQIKNISLQRCKAFREEIYNKGLKRKTVNTCMTVLSIIFNDLVEQEVISENPIKKIKPLSKDDANVGSFTIDDCKKWCNSSQINKEFRLIVTICTLTGLRINEVLALNENNIFPDHIKVNLQKQNGDSFKRVKDETPRIVPIIPELYQLLMDNKKRHGFIFTYSYSYVYKLFRDACFLLDIEDRRIEENIHIHSFRHFYNTYLLAENITGVKVDAIIGHKDKERTMQKIYTNWEPAHFNDVQEVNKKLWNIIFS